MLQSTLLLFEIVLVLAAGYFCWLTRRHMMGMRSKMASGDASQSPAPQSGQAEMMHTLADVLSDVQTSVQDMRGEWQREREALQQHLERAEKTIAEMRAQMAQARIQPVVPSVNQFAVRPAMQPVGQYGKQPVTSRMPAAAPRTGSTALALDAALELFRDHLHAGGLRDSSVRRALGPVREFAVWMGGQRYARLGLDDVRGDGIERFVEHLCRRRCSVATVRRKASSVRRFLVWSSQDVPAPVAAPHQEVGCPTPLPVMPYPAVVPVADRRQSVFTLADQGADPSMIAARAGLDRETVRMLLASRNNGHEGGAVHNGLALHFASSFPHDSAQPAPRSLS